MNMEPKKGGYVPIFRSMLNHEFLNENRPLTKFEAWVVMLLTVNYKESRIILGGEKVILQPGQSALSILAWSKLFKWSRPKTRRFLDYVQKEKMIRRKTGHKTSIITICNWETYNFLNSESVNPSVKVTVNPSVKATVNQLNKGIKKEKDIYKYISKKKKFDPLKVELPDKISEGVWIDWVEYRAQEIKKPLTERAVRRQLNFLAEQPNPDALIDITIRNQWQGLEHAVEIYNQKVDCKKDKTPDYLKHLQKLRGDS